MIHACCVCARAPTCELSSVETVRSSIPPSSRRPDGRACGRLHVADGYTTRDLHISQTGVHAWDVAHRRRGPYDRIRVDFRPRASRSPPPASWHMGRGSRGRRLGPSARRRFSVSNSILSPHRRDRSRPVGSARTTQAALAARAMRPRARAHARSSPETKSRKHASAEGASRKLLVNMAVKRIHKSQQSNTCKVKIHEAYCCGLENTVSLHKRRCALARRPQARVLPRLQRARPPSRRSAAPTYKGTE